MSVPRITEILEALRAGTYTIAIKAGTALMGKVGIDQVTANANEVVIKSFKAAATFTHTVATIGATTGEALAANAERTYVLLINNSDLDMYIKVGTAAVLNQGIRLNAHGGSYEMSMAYGNLDTRAINGISSGAGKILLVTEGT